MTRAISSSDLDDLPSLDYAVHLKQIVDFHFGQILHFFDETVFTQRLFSFYESQTVGKAEADRLWFVQFLLVLAFGKAFVVRKKQAQCLPGSNLFLRAVSLLPDCTMFFRDILTAIEVLTAISFYYQSADSRNVAYNYVSEQQQLQSILKAA